MTTLIAPAPILTNDKDQIEVRKAFSDFSDSVSMRIKETDTNVSALDKRIVSLEGMSRKDITISNSTYSPLNIPSDSNIYLINQCAVDIRATTAKDGTIIFIYNKSSSISTILFVDTNAANLSASYGVNSFIYFNGTWQPLTNVTGIISNVIWEKSPDGNMIQCGSTGAITTASAAANQFGSTAGNAYYGTVTISFPIQFISQPDSVLLSPTLDGVNSTMGACRVQNTTTSGFVALVFGGNGGTAQGYWRAHGRYK